MATRPARAWKMPAMIIKMAANTIRLAAQLLMVWSARPHRDGPCWVIGRSLFLPDTRGGLSGQPGRGVGCILAPGPSAVITCCASGAACGLAGQHSGRGGGAVLFGRGLGGNGAAAAAAWGDGPRAARAQDRRWDGPPFAVNGAAGKGCMRRRPIEP